MLSRCRWEHNIMIGRRRCVKKKIFCVVDWCMFPREIQGFIAVVAYRCHRYCMAIKAHNAGCRHLGVGKIWLAGLYSAAPWWWWKFLRGWWKRFFAVSARAGKDLFLLSRADSGSMRLYQDTHLSNMSESKFRSKMQQAKHAWPF